MLIVGMITVVFIPMDAVVDVPIDGATYVAEELAKGTDMAETLVDVEATIVVTVIVVMLLPVTEKEVAVAGASGCPSEDWVTYGLAALEMPN